MTQGRLADIEKMTIGMGAHLCLEDGACVMELVSYVAGERWSDHPRCASPAISSFLRAWNDGMNDEDRQQLRKFIVPLSQTAAPALEAQRAYLAIDWSIRIALVAWLRLGKYESHADAIATHAEIDCPAQLESIQPALDAAWDAARDAARDAAWDAATKFFRPTVLELQASAYVLVERMIALSNTAPV